MSELKRIFYGRIKPNSPLITFDNRDLFDSYVKQLCGEEETKVEITVKKYRKNRSNRQNAYYWVCLNYISKDTGELPDVLHDTFKAMFLKKQIKIKNKIISVVGSTTELDSLAFSEYIEKIASFMADFGILLPSAEEYEYEF